MGPKSSYLKILGILCVCILETIIFNGGGGGRGILKNLCPWTELLMYWLVVLA